MKTKLQNPLGLMWLVFLLCSNAFAQQPTQEWTKRYDSQGFTTENQRNVIAIDNDGNSYVAGTSTNHNTGERNIVVIKYSPTGSELWVKEYTESSYSNATAIAVDNAGSVYVTGNSWSSSGSNGYDYATIRYATSDGTQVWAKTFNGSGNSYDVATAIAVDNAGSVYVTGNSWSSSVAYDYATIRYSTSDGTQVWAKTFNGSSNSYDYATAIAVDNAGSVYVTGRSWNSSGYDDYATIRYATSDGTQVWAKTFNGSGNSYDVATAIAVDNAGSVYVTGNSWSSSVAYDYATIRYSTSDGTQVWAKTFNGSGNSYDVATAIAVDNAGSVYVTGNSWSGTSSFDDYATIRYATSDGTQVWAKTFNGSGNSYDVATAIAVDNAGSVYVTGNSWSGTSSFDDYATIRYSTSDGTQVWAKAFNGSGNDYDQATALAVDNAGSLYVTGVTHSNSNNNDYATIRYATTDGTQVWVKLYDDVGSQQDDVIAVAVDNNGNSYVAGTSTNHNTGKQNIVVIKYSPTGSELWVKEYTESSYSNATAIAVDNAGSVYVTGQSWSSSGYFDYATIRYATSDGTQVWAKTFNGSGNSYDYATDIAVDNTGSVYVTGRSYSSSGNEDYATLRYSTSDGTQVWAKTFNGSGNSYDYATAIAVDNTGSVYVTGRSYSSSGNEDYATIRYATSDGTQVWAKTFNGSGNSYDYATDIAVDNAGSVYVTGQSYSNSSGYDYATIRYATSDGTQVWAKTFNGSGNAHDFAAAIAVDNTGSVYVTGRSYSSSGNEDYATIRYSTSDGTQVWAKTFNGSGNDYARGIAVDNMGSVYVTGYSWSSSSGYVFSTIKYAPLNGDQLWDIHTPGPNDIAIAMALDNSNNVIVTGYSYSPESSSDFLTVKYSQCPTITEQAIVGSSTAAINSTGSTYSLSGSGATSFTWSITDGNNTAYTNFTGQGSSSISVSWPSTPNVYKVSVIYGGGTGCTSKTDFMYVSVFDPTAGFVTGGGWITSPQSSAYEYMHTAGKADWGFVAKYKKGQANEVDGSTQFQLETGTFTFKSIIHDARKLVIATNKANYKGRGTVSYVDGTGTTVIDPRQFAFMVAATDGQYGGATGTDKFRIKVWVVNTDGTDGVVVYDNQIGCGGSLDDNAEACTVIGGGSIMIHNPNSKSVTKGSTLVADRTTKLEAYPTAFSGSTTLAFELEQGATYTLELYDLKGALVKRIASGSVEAGKRVEHELRAEGISKGLYLARLAAGNTLQTVKVVVQK